MHNNPTLRVDFPQLF